MEHVFVTDTKGRLWAWGNNEQNQLGWSDTTMVNAPQIVPFFAEKDIKVKLADGGMGHSLALSTDGRLYSFGSNASGQLGRYQRETLVDESLPAEVNLSNLEKDEKIIDV